MIAPSRMLNPALNRSPASTFTTSFASAAKTFIFSGAGIDVKEAARDMNIDEDKAYSFERSPEGIVMNMECADKMVTGCRGIRRRK